MGILDTNTEEIKTDVEPTLKEDVSPAVAAAKTEEEKPVVTEPETNDNLVINDILDIVQSDITRKFLTHEDIGIPEIRKIGKGFFKMMKDSKMKEKFLELDGNKLYIDFVYCTVEAFTEDDAVFETFNETQKHITGYDLNELKGNDLMTAMSYSINFMKEISTGGFFSNMTSLFLNAIKG